MLLWTWTIHLPLTAADAVCFTCNQEQLFAGQSFWLYQWREQVVDCGFAGFPDPPSITALSVLTILFALITSAFSFSHGLSPR